VDRTRGTTDALRQALGSTIFAGEARLGPAAIASGMGSEVVGEAKALQGTLGAAFEAAAARDPMTRRAVRDMSRAFSGTEVNPAMDLLGMAQGESRPFTVTSNSLSLPDDLIERGLAEGWNLPGGTKRRINIFGRGSENLPRGVGVRTVRPGMEGPLPEAIYPEYPAARFGNRIENRKAGSFIAPLGSPTPFNVPALFPGELEYMQKMRFLGVTPQGTSWKDVRGIANDLAVERMRKLRSGEAVRAYDYMPRNVETYQALVNQRGNKVLDALGIRPNILDAMGIRPSSAPSIAQLQQSPLMAQVANQPARQVYRELEDTLPILEKLIAGPSIAPVSPLVPMGAGAAAAGGMGVLSSYLREG